MLDRIVVEADRVETIMDARRLDPKDFAIFESRLAKNDIEKALQSLENYLRAVGKSEYRDYIYSLIRLRYVKEDTSFADPILELARVSSKTYKFDIDSYTQSFYSALLNNDIDKAKDYLNIISSSKTISGINVDIPGMRESLVTKMGELGILDDYSKETGNRATLMAAKFDSKCKEKLATEYSHLADVFEQMINGDNLVLLEPMSDEDVENILYIASCVPYINGSLINSTDGKSKHIMLRYRAGSTEPVTRGELISSGGLAFKEKRYDDCIDFFERTITIMDNPESNIYVRLGLSYRQLVSDDDYHNVIDYLTVATHVAHSTLDDDFDFSLLVENLKRRTGYNGIKVKDDTFAMSDVSVKNENVQYVKIDKNN